MVGRKDARRERKVKGERVGKLNKLEVWRKVVSSTLRYPSCYMRKWVPSSTLGWDSFIPLAQGV
jgi:hypothetical protein